MRIDACAWSAMEGDRLKLGDELEVEGGGIHRH
jgi:hypothetical protein